MDFQGHIEKVYRMFRQAPFLLLFGGLLVQLLIVLTAGLGSGPLAGGMVLMMLQHLRQARPLEFNDLFSGLARFGRLFPFFFLELLIMVGFFIFIIPGIIFMTWWLYTLPIMVDQDLPLGRAMQASRAKVREKGFFMHLVFLLMVTVVPGLLISMAATIVPFLELLRLFLFPAQAGLLASLYVEQFGSQAESGRPCAGELPPPIPSGD